MRRIAKAARSSWKLRVLMEALVRVRLSFAGDPAMLGVRMEPGVAGLVMVGQTSVPRSSMLTRSSISAAGVDGAKNGALGRSSIEAREEELPKLPIESRKGDGGARKPRAAASSC